MEEEEQIVDQVNPDLINVVDRDEELPDVVLPEVLGEAKYNAPFRSKIGKSTVDLSIPANEEKMKQEYDEYWNYGSKRGFLGIPYVSKEFKGERDKLKEKFWQKYYGMSLEEYEAALDAPTKKTLPFYGEVEGPSIRDRQSGFYPGANPGGALNNLQNNFLALSVPGLAYTDFVMDAAGTVVPGMDKVDDRWDKASKIDNPVYQGARQVLSIVLPAIHTGQLTHSALAASPVAGYPTLHRTLISIGAYGLADGAVTLLSDTSEDHNAAKVVADLLPGWFGSKGRIPIPEAWKTKESDSPEARKLMNFYENTVLSTVGVIIGAFIDSKNAMRTRVDFFEPLDATASNYKQLELFKLSDSDDIIRLQELNTILSTKKLSKQNENLLINEIIGIENKLGIDRGLEARLQRQELGFKAEADAAARRKLQDVEQLELDLDPDITPGLLDPAAAVRSTPPPANVARNVADTTAIKNGTSKGDPAPIMTEAMREKGLMVGQTSRGAVMGVAEETRDLGRFNAVVDGIRYTSKQMNAAAWDIYTSIIAAENMDDVRALFLDNKDVKNFLMGRFKVEVFNEEQARAAAFALRDLTDRFLGREVTEASARVMDTLGRESATLAEVIQKGGPYVDDDRVMDLIIDKMQYLLDEYALNKYLSGWSLRNKNWFDQVPPKELDTVIEQLTKEFTDAENAIHAKNLKFTETLKELKKSKPHFLRPLVDAFAHTNGDVDSLAKLNKWAASEVSPMGMIKSPNPREMSLFAKSAWSVVMNNVLSGLSAFRAGLGNTYALVMKPITSVLGHGIWGATDGFEGLKRSSYMFGSVFETNRRALNDGFEMMKKAHKDPDMMVKAYRKDFTFQADKKWDIMEEMRAAWETEGDWGHIIQHDLVSGMRDLGRHPAMRYGMTGLVFPDAYTSTMLAHYLARVRAYDDVFSEFGFADWTKIHTAEAQHYKKFFDSNGLIKDDVLRAVAGEIQLNLDDGLATWLNKGTTAYPITKFLMMFPRTSSNYIKASASWTPLSLIPGFNKYSKTIWARTDEQIALALAEHGIDMATTPNARIIFENLRAEYTGRLAFSGILTGTLWQYAMAGNIRGNGSYNASRRQKERDNFGYEPKTINIGGKWVSYEGLWGIEQVLSILGDMAYYASDLNEPTLANWQSKLTWTIAASFLNDSPLQGFEPLIAATNGDMSGWNRLIANTARSTLPLSGGAGVVANAISSSQKDLEGSVKEYLMNRLPGFNMLLPEQRDIWTGDPLNDIDNPILKALNALMPTKVSGTREPWRVWLQEIQYDGLSRLTRDSTGSYEYSAAEREQIMDYIGDMELYREVIKLMNNKNIKKQIELLRTHRSTSVDANDQSLQLKKKLLPVYQHLNRLLKNAQKQAEARLAIENPDIVTTIRSQRYVNNEMKKGNVQGAIDMQKEHLENKKLLEYGGSR